MIKSVKYMESLLMMRSVRESVVIAVNESTFSVTEVSHAEILSAITSSHSICRALHLLN